MNFFGNEQQVFPFSRLIEFLAPSNPEIKTMELLVSDTLLF